jgi:hypothetical protein
MKVTTAVMMFQAATKRRASQAHLFYPPRSCYCCKDSINTSRCLPSSREKNSHHRCRIRRPPQWPNIEAEWLAKLNSRRSRLRDTQEAVTPSGMKETRVVSEKVHLPNIIDASSSALCPTSHQRARRTTLTKRRSASPQSVTKTDVRAYLAVVYGVQTTYIRTGNYFAHGRARHVERCLST